MTSKSRTCTCIRVRTYDPYVRTRHHGRPVSYTQVDVTAYARSIIDYCMRISHIYMPNSGGQILAPQFCEIPAGGDRTIIEHYVIGYVDANFQIWQQLLVTVSVVISRSQSDIKGTSRRATKVAACIYIHNIII